MGDTLVGGVKPSWLSRVTTDQWRGGLKGGGERFERGGVTWERRREV